MDGMLLITLKRRNENEGIHSHGNTSRCMVRLNTQI